MIELFLSDTGHYDDAWASVHMNPADVLKAAEDVHAKWQIPVHWGAWNEPPELLTQYAENSDVNVETPKICETVNMNNIINFHLVIIEPLR